MNLHKKCTEKLYSFLVIDTTLASDNSSRFRKNLLERIQKLIMTIDDKTIDEKNKNNMILARKQQKCKHYLQVKLINANILKVKKYYYLIKVE